MVSVALWSVIAVFVLSVVAFGCFRSYVWLTTPGGTVSTTRARRVLLGGEVAFGVLTLVVLSGLGAIDEIHAVLASLGVPSVLGIFVWLPLALAITVVVIAGYLGFLPVVREYHEGDISTFRAMTAMFRWTFTFLFLFGVLCTLFFFVLTIDGEHRLIPPMGIALVIIITYIAGPWIVRFSRSTRSLTEAERERYDRLSDAVDIDVDRVHVLNGSDNRIAMTFVRGIPRQLFVTDHLFEAYDDEYVSVVLAAIGTRLRYHHIEYKFGGMMVLVPLLIGLVTMDGSGLTVLAYGAFVIVGGVFVWYGNRLVYHADRGVADRFGQQRVITVYEQLASEHGTDTQKRSWLRTLRMNPSLGRRIAWLRNRADSMD